jgi:hypothetical protein
LLIAAFATPHAGKYVIWSPPVKPMTMLKTLIAVAQTAVSIAVFVCTHLREIFVRQKSNRGATKPRDRNPVESHPLEALWSNGPVPVLRRNARTLIQRQDKGRKALVR